MELHFQGKLSVGLNPLKQSLALQVRTNIRSKNETCNNRAHYCYNYICSLSFVLYRRVFELMTQFKNELHYKYPTG